ncbi:hypothetical protein EPN52_03125 [bacterium]|nr:MAG: hypothetical protein EPN52_03125 [bacterium]
MVSSSIRHLLLALLTAGTLGLAACGGGGGSTTPNPGAPPSSPPAVSGTCQAPPAPGTGTAYAAGATRTWCLSVATIGTSNVTYENVATTLLAQSTHLNVWVDNADLGALTTPQWQQIAGDFDAIYPKDTAYFGGTTFPWLGQQSQYTFSECDANGNALTTGQYVSQPNFSSGNGNNGYGAQIDMVITDKLGTGEGGYFNSIDLVSNASAHCTLGAPSYSNEAQVFFAEAPGQVPQSFYLNGDVLRTEAHEFQHMLHAINKTYTLFAKNGPPEIADPSWIDEGFSMLAEDLATNSGDPIRFAYQYAIAPSNYSLTSFEGFACAPAATSTNCPTSIYNYTAGNYGAAYLFWRWAVDRYDSGILAQIIKNSDTGPNGTGTNEVQAALGGTFPQLFQQFSLAFAGSLAYGVTAPQPYTALPSPSFDDSYGSYTIPSPCQGPPSDPHITCDLAAHTATFKFYGPQPPSNGYSLPATGMPQTLSLYVGTANYIPVSGAAAPNSMTADDGSGAADGLLVGAAYMTSMRAGTVNACSGGSSTSASCVVNTTPFAGAQPPAETFLVDLANAAAPSSGTPTLAQPTLTLTATLGTAPPSEAKLPVAAGAPRLPGAAQSLGDGFLRTDRPAAVGQQALTRLFARGAVRSTLLQGQRRR